MNQILPLELRFSDEGAQKTLHPTLLCHGRARILVDCGYPGFLALPADTYHCFHGGTFRRDT